MLVLQPPVTVLFYKQGFAQKSFLFCKIQFFKEVVAGFGGFEKDCKKS
jgi:hypothetical protein